MRASPNKAGHEVLTANVITVYTIAVKRCSRALSVNVGAAFDFGRFTGKRYEWSACSLY
jgi:hypothetical protein